jgi:hypothetical protein
VGVIKEAEKQDAREQIENCNRCGDKPQRR